MSSSFSLPNLLFPFLLLASIAIAKVAVDAKSVVLKVNATVTLMKDSSSSSSSSEEGIDGGGNQPLQLPEEELDYGQKVALAMVATSHDPHAEQLACEANRLNEFVMAHHGFSPKDGLVALKVKLNCFQGEEDNSECCAAEGMSENCLPICNGQKGTESNLTGVFKKPEGINGCIFYYSPIIYKCIMNNTFVRSRLEAELQSIVGIVVEEHGKKLAAASMETGDVENEEEENDEKNDEEENDEKNDENDVEDDEKNDDEKNNEEDDEEGVSCEMAKEGCNFGCEATCQIAAGESCALTGPLNPICVSSAIPFCLVPCLIACGHLC